MNGLDKIIARMEADTRVECDALAANAAGNADAILRDYQAQADAVARDSAQRAETQAAEHLEHLNGSSQLVCRQRVLAAKQQLIDEAFARTAQALAALPQADYIDLLAALAAENGSGDEELLLSAHDRETVGAAVVDAANAKKPGTAFRLSDETRDTGGGLVLRRGRVAAASINIVAKRPEAATKGIIYCGIVEFYAILSLVATIMISLNILK